jgi:signal transduction histidine kinase
VPGLQRLASELTEEQAPKGILERLCSRVREILGARLTAIALVVEASQNLKIEYFDASSSVTDPSADLNAISSLVSPAGRGPEQTGPKLQAKGASFLSVRLKTSTKLYGMLCLWGEVGAGPFSESAEEIANIAADLAAIAYENSLRRETVQALDTQVRLLTIQQASEREQERHRVSMAIHDDLGQDLTALKIELQFLARRLPTDRSEVIERLIALSSNVDNLIHHVRRIATDLRLPVLDLGLIPAIRDLASRFEARTSIRCNVVADDGIEVGLPYAIAIFRVLQESLTNIARHSEATKITVALRLTGDCLTLEVHDNGRGLAPNAPNTSSLGIRGMRERAAQFGGTLTIESRAKSGTTVTMRLPLI